MLVGAGNAYVAEAKRQLFGAVAIDLLAGPSEVAVIADDTADPEIVAADLLGQAEHGPNSPAALVTTSEELGRAVSTPSTVSSATLATEPIAGPAWRDYGSVTVADDRETAVALMDDLAPEHLEVHHRRRRLVPRPPAQLRVDLHRHRGAPSPTPTRAWRAPTTCCPPPAAPSTARGSRCPAS